MQISLRGKRKLPKWDRKLWKWLCYIKSRIICSASDLPGVEVVPFLHDLRWREGEIELCRIWTVQWILRMKASLCFIFSCSVAPSASRKNPQLWILSMPSSSRKGHIPSSWNQWWKNLGCKLIDFSFWNPISLGKFQKTSTTYPIWPEQIAKFNMLTFSRINPY